MIKIRGHHFLCIEGFRGHGYSSDFVRNMKEIILKLKDDVDVVIVDFPDDICIFCPNLKDGRCVNEKGGEEYVLKMDRNFLSKSGFQSMKTYRYSYIKKIIYEVFKTKKDLLGICDVCSWKKICAWYLSRDD